MKLIHLSVASLLLLIGLTQAALAQGQRYPTEREMQSLSQQFKRKLPSLKNGPTRTYSDRRTPAERQQRETFVQSWARFDPAVATFLGGWTAIEESMLIYPSRTKGQVCIIETFIPGANDSGFALTLGKVVRGRVQTGNRKILIRQDAFLGSAGVFNGKAGLYEYANPRPLQDPATVDYFQRVPSIVNQFKQAGCTARLPR
ncbi:hypothetical protein H6F86_30930 [Phormidium sp. FACHB-592]|uniref:Uncharacterized protein n=1 Tax=Stenomitos frigidus AS-A4 TaxID=2933935 RepID=A0ABV0KRU5_9CYAN|nr:MULTISPECIES: hypothetical protein [Cyanophyceae]MBD2033583.1 hypothetical protein [Leptolyngbya sp. FACHB-321]MBD2078227.1 hypothetical protein [Phormidium sp. FACHB-592]